MSENNFPNEDQQNYLPPGNMQYNAPQNNNAGYQNNAYINNPYTAKNPGAKTPYNQYSAPYGNGNQYYPSQNYHGHYEHHYAHGGPYHHHYEHGYGPQAYGQNYNYGTYGPYNGNYGPYTNMDDDYMKHHWSHWLHPGFMKSFMRSPKVNNFFRGVGVATVGLLVAPSVARVLKPIAVQVLHGVKDITDELKGVMDDARGDMEDIFADANWEGLKLDEDKKMES